MTYDPSNVPPGSARDRAAQRSGPASTGLIIGLVIAALVVAGLFYVWPNRGADIAQREPAVTGTTSPTPGQGAPQTPAPPAAPAPAAPAAPAAPR